MTALQGVIRVGSARISSDITKAKGFGCIEKFTRLNKRKAKMTQSQFRLPALDFLKFWATSPPPLLAPDSIIKVNAS